MSEATAGSAPGAKVDVDVLSSRGFLNVRLNPRDELAVKAVEQILGQAVPLVSNTYGRGEHRVYWLGPDEWLIETDAGDVVALENELAMALAGSSAAINDVSGGYVALRIVGADARTVLAKGCTLDLHPPEFRPGRCARTGLARTTILLAADGEPDSYTIIVARSFTDYLRRWLAHAAEK